MTRFRYPDRKPFDRQAIARAFVAKALYRHPTTRDLHRALQSAGNLRLICGFAALGDIPSESTFSRAFAEFAAGSFGNRVHDALVKQYLAEELVGHISRDSTAIAGREKPAKKVAKEARKPRKRGRLAKGEQREPAIEKRFDRQVRQTVEETIRELPVNCDRGTKKNAKGYKMSWNGFKLHMDTNDIGLPISALVTSASLHDSQVAIPLIKLTSRKVTYFYDLMDPAYDAKRIEDTSRECGHVPITDKNGRGKEVIPVALTLPLYGILFSNYFFLPFAANLRERTNHELLLQKIIMEGVIAIDSEMNSVILKTKLESFLTPSERIKTLVSYRKIKERFNIREEAEEGPRVHD